MAVKIAEYLGKKTEIEKPIIEPVSGHELCPFMNDICIKLAQKNKPVCTVRKPNGDLWIVCRNRLCATKDKISLTIYQKEILLEVAKCVFGNDIHEDDIAIKREVKIPVIDNSNYHADYIMMNIGSRGSKNGQRRIVLEMQGGGETSNTGEITRLIEAWESTENRANKQLSKMTTASPIITNAWRRQQEQFIIKGNIAQQTGGGIVFCVGKPLYDYLWSRVRDANLNDLRSHNWTLALIAFKEDISSTSETIKFVIDPERVIFTNYLTFIQTLINQGKPNPEMFEGWFELLNGDVININA